MTTATRNQRPQGARARATAAQARRARELFAARAATNLASVIRQMLAAGETPASIRALTGASSQAIYAARNAGERRGRPLSRSKALALSKAAQLLEIEIDAGGEDDEHVVLLGALRRALGQAYDDGVYAGGREKVQPGSRSTKPRKGR